MAPEGGAATPNVPDLLQPVAARRIDFEQTKFAMIAAFAGGSGGLFGDALERATLPASGWTPAHFAGDLFLQRFVSQCWRARIDRAEPVLTTAYLLRVLAHPPADPETIRFRREVLAELAASPELRHGFERLYLEISRLRGLLENTGSARIWDANRRKLDILEALRRVFDHMAKDFAGARSGLRRIHDFGASVVGSEPYRALTDLLRYDSDLATLSLKVGVGADGRIRGFEVLAVSEDTDNPFVSPFWKRWLSKLELFVRGYHFSDGEVMARLVDSVVTGVEDEMVVLVQLVGDLELYLGALGFRDRAQAAGLEVCLPDLVDPDEPRELSGLFNPLLLMGGVTPVPCDLHVDGRTSTTLVTGPNSGGKTRLLQAIGFAQLLGQGGFFVPARSGRIALASGLVASIVEETMADQAEGRLGMELMRIRQLFEHLPPRAMVLLDELCSGTNPSEGEQIFELVVTMLDRLRPQAFITTHFLAFAGRLADARRVPGLDFMQVDLDADRRPTYQFVPGVAQSSLAGDTAERLGVTGEQLLQLIERNARTRAAGTTADR